MSLQELLKQAQGGSPGAGSSSGLRGLINEAKEIPEFTRQAQREAEAAKFESDANGGFRGVLKNTAKETGSRLINIPLDTYRGMRDMQTNFVNKTKANIQQGAAEYQKREPLSLAKVGFRSMGDSVEVIFAPLSAAIGSILKASGGAALTDKAGNFIADKSGITDWPAFQKFAVEHPNAGEDFNRLLNLVTLGAAESNAKISPTTMVQRTTAQIQAVARKIVAPTPKPTGIQKLVVEAQSAERQVPLNTPGSRMEKYSQEQGYEGYVPDDQLPTIPFGPKGKSELPTIRYDDPQGPAAPDGMTYEPIPARPSPMSVDQTLGNKTKSPEIGTVSPKPVAGTGEVKTRGLAMGVEAKAVENKLTKDLGQLPEYQRVSMADQAQQATDLIVRDYEQAKRIAKGQELPPEGLLPESVFVAVENRAIKEGDVATLRDLANGQLVSEATTMGQRIRTLAERNPDSPTTAIRAIAEARKQKTNGADVSKIKRTELAKVKQAVKNSRPTRQNWSDFIREIQCT